MGGGSHHMLLPLPAASAPLFALRAARSIPMRAPFGIRERQMTVSVSRLLDRVEVGHLLEPIRGHLAGGHTTERRWCGGKVGRRRVDDRSPCRPPSGGRRTVARSFGARAAPTLRNCAFLSTPRGTPARPRRAPRAPPASRRHSCPSRGTRPNASPASLSTTFETHGRCSPAFSVGGAASHLEPPSVGHTTSESSANIGVLAHAIEASPPSKPARSNVSDAKERSLSTADAAASGHVALRR